MLEVSLAIINYLNGTTFRGGAWGFKLDSISNLEQTKSVDGKDNGAFFVVRKVWQKYSYPIFSPDEVESYRPTTKILMNLLGG